LLKRRFVGVREKKSSGVGVNSRESELRVQRFECEALAHLDSLLKAAGRIAFHSGDAEDIVQETCLRAWKYFDSFEEGTNCRAWLFGIMFNVINARRGKQSRMVETPLEEDDILDSRFNNVLVFDPLKRLEGREVLDEANKLSEDHRAVLSLVVVEEFSYQEAAGILDVPVGTVMSRLHRARRELRKRLAVTRASGENG
jgi:RNA polymerase sigma-70 factor, ECF subfamily